MVKSELNHNLVGGHRKAGRTSELFLHRVHNMMRPERLSIILPNVTVRRKARFRTQITGKLPRVIVFNDNHPPALRKDALHMLGVERDDPFNRELVRDDALFRCKLFHRFADDTLS